jgi:hypothetical protein
MGNNTPKKNRSDQTTADQTLIDGFNEHATLISGMFISGASRSRREIVATLQSRIDSSERVVAARANWLAAVEADRTLHHETQPFIAIVKRGLLAMLDGHALADFGLTLRETYIGSADARKAAAVKAKATRAARLAARAG